MNKKVTSEHFCAVFREQWNVETEISCALISAFMSYKEATFRSPDFMLRYGHVAYLFQWTQRNAWASVKIGVTGNVSINFNFFLLP